MHKNFTSVYNFSLNKGKELTEKFSLESALHGCTVDRISDLNKIYLLVNRGDVKTADSNKIVLLPNIHLQGRLLRNLKLTYIRPVFTIKGFI